MTNSLKAAETCYLLINSFLGSSPEDALYNQNLPPDGGIHHEHGSLKLPSLYPPSFDSQLHRSTQEKALETYNGFLSILDEYDLDELSVSYNGGKDCLVQLIIYMAAIYKYVIVDGRGTDLSQTKINAVYVYTEKEFDEQIRFLEDSVSQFGLDFTAVYTSPDGSGPKEHVPDAQMIHCPQNTAKTGSIENLFSSSSTLQSGFLTYLNSHPSIKAIVVGIRRTDPYGSDLNFQQITDTNKGWPEFMRVNPILEWHTCEIWYFIKWFQRNSKASDFTVSYCSLYDDGYTSLGGRDNTVRNPRLKRKDASGVSFWPAWWVLADDIERLSRIQKGKV